jgi:hypothetical protein
MRTEDRMRHTLGHGRFDLRTTWTRGFAWRRPADRGQSGFHFSRLSPLCPIKPLTTTRLQKDEAQLAELHEDLAHFEGRYAMTSADFHTRYQAGQMGDDADVFEWNALYKMQSRLADAVNTLRGQLRE